MQPKLILANRLNFKIANNDLNFNYIIVLLIMFTIFCLMLKHKTKITKKEKQTNLINFLHYIKNFK